MELVKAEGGGFVGRAAENQARLLLDQVGNGVKHRLGHIVTGCVVGISCNRGLLVISPCFECRHRCGSYQVLDCDKVVANSRL